MPSRDDDMPQVLFINSCCLACIAQERLLSPIVRQLLGYICCRASLGCYGVVDDSRSRRPEARTEGSQGQISTQTYQTCSLRTLLKEVPRLSKYGNGRARS